MERSVLVLWVLVLVLLLVVGALAAKMFVPTLPFFDRAESYYAALYLDSGEIYFGMLTTAPTPTLSKVHFLQKDTAGNFSVSKFRDALYRPTDQIRLNPEKIIWIAQLQDASPMVTTLKADE